MSGLKRPKIFKGLTASGVQYYYCRKPSTARLKKATPRLKGRFRDRKKAKAG